jgi:hypothetical protein
MRFRQLLVKNAGDLVPVRLGKPLDKRLAGKEIVVVVRIEKDVAYEVMTIQRMTGGARRFTFAEELVSEAIPDLVL